MKADDMGSRHEPMSPGKLTFQASTWHLLALAGAQARHLWADMLAQLQVSPSQFKVLQALRESGPLRQYQVADLIGVDPRNAVPLIDSLADRGLLAREIDPADRRRRVLTLTARGQRLATDLAAIAAEHETDFFSPLTTAEQKALRRMLLSLLRA